MIIELLAVLPAKTGWLFKLIATATAATGWVMVAQAQPDTHSLGLSILGVGGGTMTWLLSRQIRQLDEAMREFHRVDQDHELRLNRHGKSIAALKIWSKLPNMEQFE